MYDDELANYSEDNFALMIDGLKAHERREDLSKFFARNIRWWVKFLGVVSGIVFAAFWCGWFLSAVSR